MTVLQKVFRKIWKERPSIFFPQSMLEGSYPFDKFVFSVMLLAMAEQNSNIYEK